MAVRKHGTTTAATATGAISLVGKGREVEVISHGPSAIYATGDGTTPTVQGDDTFVALPGGSVLVPCQDSDGDGDLVVNLISELATDYSVEVLNK